MFKPFYLGIAILALSGCAHIEPAPTADNATAGQKQEPYTGSYIRRPTLLVSNMEQSLSLYRDILGFKLGSLKQDPPDSYVYESFNIPAGTIVRHATLDSDTEKRTLSLVEVKSLKSYAAPDGFRRTAILVNANGRFGEISSALRDQGYEMLNPHPLGASGTEMGFIDSDGHLIVVYQFGN